jgi:hypothetical protein
MNKTTKLDAFGGLLDIMDELRENVRGIKKNKRWEDLRPFDIGSQTW